MPTTDKGSQSQPSSQPPPPPATGPSPIQAALAPQPYNLVGSRVVFTIKTKKKKKRRKYSAGLKGVQKLERGVTRASQRVSWALNRGMATYRKRRDKSSRKRRDGAIIDALENWSKGFGRTARIASDAPYDIAKQIRVRRIRRGVRDTIRLFTFPLFR